MAALDVDRLRRGASVRLPGSSEVVRLVSVAPGPFWEFFFDGPSGPGKRVLAESELGGLELIDVVGSPRGDLLAPRVGQRAAIQLALDAGLWWSPWPRLALGVHGAVSVALLRAGFEFGRSDGGAIAVPPGGRVGGRVGASLAVRLR